MALRLRRPNADGNYTDWTPNSGTIHYNRVYEADPHDGDTSYIYQTSTLEERDSFRFPYAGEDAIPSGATDISIKVYLVAKKVGIFSAKIKPFLRFSSTNNDGTEITVSSTSYSEFSETITKPGGGSWTAAEINSADWEAGVLIIANIARVTQLWVEITYTTANHPAPTSLECERVAEPTNAGDSPVFSAIFNANGGSGSADRAWMQVSGSTDFISNVWNTGWFIISSVSHGNRCEEIEYGGSYLSSAPADGVYYWRIKFKNNTTGIESLWSDDSTADPSEFSGINRDWHDADYPFRQKLTFDGEQPALDAGYLVAAKINTGNRRIVASNGNFNESVQASGGFSIVRYGGKTHIVFLSKLDNVYELGIWIVTINHITGEVGTPYRICNAGTSSDTHLFPVIDADNSGYLHVAYGCHGGALKYRRSTVSNVSGSLAGDPASGNWWNEVEAPGNSDHATYPVAMTIPHTGRIYIFFRGGSVDDSSRWSFIYSDNNGVTWYGAYILIHDQSTNAFRVYPYGVRYDPKARRLHVSWSLNHDGDIEKGVWYSYCDYDETDGSSLDVGFNITRWADDTLSGRTSNGADARTPVSGWVGSSAVNPITTSADELSLVFTETLVLTKAGEPIVFWEQKFDQGSGLYAHQTNVLCAKWDSDFSMWVITAVSDQVNTKLRVRRSSLAGMADRDGIIHLYMPVLARTEYRFGATGDVDEVGTVSRAAGSDNYAMVGGGFSRIGQGTWIKISGDGSKVSFDHSTADPAGVSTIFSLTIRAIVKVTGSDSTGTFYISDGATDDDSASIDFTTNTIKEYTAEWATNPFTSSAWAVDDLADLEFGLHCTSANEIQIFRIFMEVTLTKASNDEYFASEIHELISTDDGDTWTIREVSRNSSLGVPQMNHKHDLSGDVIEIMYSAGNDIFYLTDEPYGMMLPSGQDIRILYGTAEIDRVVANHFNLHESEIHFKLQEALAAGALASAKDYYLEFGNRNVSDQPKSDPDVVYVFFESFEEWDNGDTITSWTVISGTAVAYASPPQHSIKRYAGRVSMAASGAFEAKKVIGSGLTNLYVEGSFWYEGTGSGCIYIGVRDSGGNEFRVGLNYSTSMASYYDGSWHDHKTKVARRANNTRFALLVNSTGCTAWADGVKICDDVTCLTSVDEIRLGAPGLTYFDYIKAWHSLAAHDTDTITSGFTDDNIIESAMHSSLYQSIYDGRHDIASSLKITKIEITLEALDIGSGGTPQPHWLDFWICTEAIYNPGASDVNIERHVGGDTHTCIWAGDEAAQKTFVFDSSLHWYVGDNPHPEDNTTDEYAMNLDNYATEPTLNANKSVKIDCWNSSGVDPTITIKKIKVYYERRDLGVVVGDMEARGFYCDAALLGAGIFQFESDAKLEGVFIRSQAKLPVESLRGLAAKSALPVSYEQGLQTHANVLVESQEGLAAETMLQVSYSRGLDCHGTVPIEHLVSQQAHGQCVLDHLASGTLTGQLSLGVAGSLAAPSLVLVGGGLNVQQDGSLLAAWSGWLGASNIVQIESMTAWAHPLLLPVSHGQGLNVQSTILVESQRGLAATSTITTSSLQSLGCYGTVPIGYQSYQQAYVQCVIENLTSMSQTGQLLLGSSGTTAVLGVVNIGSLGGLAQGSAVNVDFAGGLTMPVLVPVEHGLSVQPDGLLVADWGGNVSAANIVQIESVTALAHSLSLPIEHLLRLESVHQTLAAWLGGPAISGQVILGLVGTLTVDGVVNIEETVMVSARNVAPAEFGEGQSTEAIVSADLGVEVPTRIIIPIAVLGSHEQAATIPVEHRLTTQTQDIVAIESGQGVQTEATVTGENLATLQIDGIVPLAWTGGVLVTAYGMLPIEWTGELSCGSIVPTAHLQAAELQPMQVLMEFAGSVAIQSDVISDWLASCGAAHQICLDAQAVIESGLQVLVEITEQKYATGQLPISVRKGLQVIDQITIGWMGGVVVQAQGLIPVEWVVGLQADGTVTIEHLKAATASAILPAETGYGVRAAASLPSDSLTTLSDLICQVTIESLASLTAQHRINLESGSIGRAEVQVAIEHLVQRVSTAQVPAEWTQFSGVVAIGILPMCWRTTLAVQAELPVELRSSLDVVGGQLLMDWGRRTRATMQLVGEYGRAITAAGQLISEWLGAIEAYGKLSISPRGTMGTVLQLEIEYGSGVVTTAAVPLTILRDLAVQHQLPMDWIGFLVTLLTVSNPQLKIPGALGACIALPQVSDYLVKLAGVTGAELRTAGARDAALKLIDEINATLRGG